MNKFQSSTRQSVRRLLSASTAAILFFSISLPAFAQTFSQTFSDVGSLNHNATAIEFLAKNNIITGYPDGTFKPDNPVSRVEFLKLALLSSNISLDVTTPTGFTDVDENAWYAPYVRKAKKEGWVQGYGDNTFKPSQSVNKVEGLKMIAEIQAWQTPTTLSAPFEDTPITAWYTPIVLYAKEHNFLEENGSFFIPSASLSRAKTSEVLFRALITKAASAQNYTTDLINQFPNDLLPTTTQPVVSPTPVPVNFTPAVYKSYAKSYFVNITLNQDFPNTFYQNEIYLFQGQISGTTAKSVYAFLNDGLNESFQNMPEHTTNGTFSIPVIFRRPGNYKLGIVPDTATSSAYSDISVLPNLPQASTTGSSTMPTGLQIKYLNQKTNVSWNNGTDNLAKITFTEGGVSKTFFSRQNNKYVDLIYNDFQNFLPGQISFKVESANGTLNGPLQINTPWTSSSSQTFSATQHTFSETHPDETTYNILPEIMNSPGNITFSGQTTTEIFKQVSIIRPDGKVDNIDVQSSSPASTYESQATILPGGSYTFNYTATNIGTYIIEINGKDGLATLNTPVYVGNGVPLTPDFFDLENSDALDDASISLSTLSNNLLNLINQERTKYSLNAVVTDATLTVMAQNHTDDMKQQNYFGHVTPQGLTPDDRRKALGILTPVGENLAKAPNIPYAHYGLMRSAIHRTNILDPDWTKLGIGITRASDGEELVAEEFSTSPLDAATLSNIRGNIYTQINQKRQNSGIAAISTNATLESVASNWSSAMVTQNFFDFVAPDGSSLSKNVQKAVPNKTVHIYILESQSQQDLINEIYSSTEVLSAQWKTIGIGLSSDNQGTLKLTLLLST